MNSNLEYSKLEYLIKHVQSGITVSTVTQVRIRTPEDAAMMLSESLALYLANRPALPAFKFGHWLASSSDATLSHMMDLASAFENNAADAHTMDLVSLGTMAMAAELGQSTHAVSAEDLAAFCARCGIYVELERTRRLGWVRLVGTISLVDPDSVKIEFTEQGLREMGEQLGVTR